MTNPLQIELYLVVRVGEFVNYVCGIGGGGGGDGLVLVLELGSRFVNLLIWM